MHSVSLFNVIVDKQLGMTTLRNSRLFSTPSVVSPRNDGRFPFIQNFRKNLETAANGTEMSPKTFQKFRKLLNFRNANHSTENSRNPGSKVEWKANSREKFLENLGIPREVVLFCGNFGECFATHIWKLPKI